MKAQEIYAKKCGQHEIYLKQITNGENVDIQIHSTCLTSPVYVYTLKEFDY